ncbi:hypothetical protein [Frankia sp. Cas3]|uniref:hypothetical protein n=1 Tax=Frankia sp. Cas3 TaxID=3073926 RepID=UPI002AD53326|nr:hypothetical protein [Frankia sp. Cas3]
MRSGRVRVDQPDDDLVDVNGARQRLTTHPSSAGPSYSHPTSGSEVTPNPAWGPGLLPTDR